MIGSQTLPAIAFVAAISGLPGLKGVPLPNSKEYKEAKAQAVAADTLPIPWKPSWRLALENHFVMAGLSPIGRREGGSLKLQAQYDPRRVRVSVEPDSGIYRSTVEVGEVKVSASYRRTLDQFTAEYSARSFRERWLDHSRRNLNSLGKDTPVQKTGLSLPIPVKLPQRLTSILGPGGPALNVSGSESIRLSGTSNWTNAAVGRSGIIGQKNSMFPSLDLQQDLDIRLEGQLSDRIKVNLLQNSANQVPLANRIAINYRGDEDDFVQALDLGNTSLTLPGTQYVSSSGKNEGLFGIKFASRVGALDFTALASKQEGRSERAVYSGGGASRGQPIPFNDLDWVKGQYFLLYDPNFGTVYDVEESSIRLYLDDRNATNDLGEVKRGKAVIDPDGVMGMPLSSASDTAVHRGNFDILNPGADQQYEVLNNLYSFRDTLFKVIRLKQKIPEHVNYVLAVTYRASPIIGPGHQLGPAIQVGDRLITAPDPDSGYTLMKMLRAARDVQASKDGVYDTTAAFAPVRELELKNFYDLQGYQIDPRSFKLMLKSGQDEPPITDLDGIPFLEMLGLDQWDEQTAQPRTGHDGLVDGFGFNSQTRGWVDYVNGTLFLPDPRPFAPRISGPGARPFDQYIDAQLHRRNRLQGATGTVNAPNPGAYELYIPKKEDAQWYFVAEYASARSGGGDITLGRGNILDNSEAVMVNGERWVRDRDYTIDYELGRITLKRQLGPSDQLSVDYSYAPLFAQASKTLIGSAFRLEGRDKSFGGAFLYESKGAQDLRPRLGEEPSRTIITDLNTEWRFKPAFLTRLADMLPGVRTTTPSEFNIQAEAGASFPNPNTKNEVFIDDMEGVRDAVSLSLTPDRWRWSSVPRRALSVVDGAAVATQSFLDIPDQQYAEVHWYAPVRGEDGSGDADLTRERDLRPNLQKDNPAVADNIHNVLSISIPRLPDPVLTPGFQPSDKLWTGLTYNLDGNGLDLSRSQFIELWVSDWNDHHNPAVRDPRIRGGNGVPSVKLHIDLGRVSEDQMRAPNRPPNGRIDTEDQIQNDNQLTVTDGRTEDNDIDGIRNDDELSAMFARGDTVIADLVNASNSDVEGDNWGNINQDFRSAADPRRYARLNGTEGNKDAYPIPDTEDLNTDEDLGRDERYFEYTIDLGAQDSPYLVTEVIRDSTVTPAPDSTKIGWRRYRIPITDSLRVRFGLPDLSRTQHVRVWLEDLKQDENIPGLQSMRPMLMIGGFDIVGSRWFASDLTRRQRDTLHTTVTLNSVNNVDHAEIYRPPFQQETTRGEGNQEIERREQSIALEFTDLHPADSLEAFRSFSLPENYSRYGALNWFAAGFQVTKQDASGADLGEYDPAVDPLYYFVRFASDDKGQNYYEVKRRLPPSSEPLNISWQEALTRIEEMSAVKLDPNFPTRDPIVYRTQMANGDSLILKGRPSFTRLLRISVGLVNESSDRRYTGQLWFDELRATDVAKDMGIANRVLVNGRWANLLDYNVAWNTRDADFLSVGETRGSGNRISSLNVNTRFEAHRFFEGTGIVLPISFSQSEQSSRPRFTAGDDIIRTGSLATASETRSLSRVMSVSYSRVWSERSNPFLRYTVGGITANLSRSTNDSRSPTSLGNSRTVNGNVNYSIAPRSLLHFPLPLTRARFFPLPERFYWNYQVTETKSEAFTRVFGTDSLRPSSSANGRAATVDFGADTRPIDLLSHHIEGRRNLALDGQRLDRMGFVNLGRLVSWRQSFASHASINPHPWLRPTFNWSSNYNQVNDTQSPDLAARAISNGQEVGMNWDLPFDRLVTTTSAASPRPAPGDTTRGAARKGPGFMPVRSLLSRLGPFSADWRLGRNSSY